MVGAVAAKCVVPRDLLIGQELGRSKVRGEVNEAKPRAAPFDVAQHLPQVLLRDRSRWKTVANEIGTSPEALYRELAKRRGEITRA